jgi:putative flippase GtrA
MQKLLSHTFASLSASPRIQRHLSQGIRFVLVGGTGSLIDLSTLGALVAYADMSPYIAQVISTLLSVSVVFTLNKLFTFRSRASRQTHVELMRFIFVYGVAITSNIALTSLFIWLGVHHLIAKCLAIGIGIVWNYGMSHAFVFKRKDQELLQEAAVV